MSNIEASAEVSKFSGVGNIPGRSVETQQGKIGRRLEGAKDTLGRVLRMGPFRHSPKAAYSSENLSEPQNPAFSNGQLNEAYKLFRPDRERGKENNEPEQLLPLTPEDVQTMINEGWFEDWDRIKGLQGDAINRNTYPKEWNDETRKKFRDEVLMPFYFPGGPIHVVARDENGGLIREVDVERHSFAFKWRGKLVAVRSYMDKDPWATEADFNKFKMAHAQMFVVAPGSEDSGFGTGLGAYFHEKIFYDRGFDQIVTWVNHAGIDYALQEKFFEKMGYEEERGRRGKITVNPTDPDRKMGMRKYRLTAKKLNNNLISENNTWVRWERKKRALMLAEAHQGFSS